jgi:hypothetical protein
MINTRPDEIGILLPNNRRQHRTLHIEKDVLPYAFCWLLCPAPAALASPTPDCPSRPATADVPAE